MRSWGGGGDFDGRKFNRALNVVARFLFLAGSVPSGPLLGQRFRFASLERHAALTGFWGTLTGGATDSLLECSGQRSDTL